MGRRSLERITDLAREDYLLRVFCMACGHVAKLDPVQVRLHCHTDRQRLIDHIERRMRCGQCGERKAACTPTDRD